MSSGSYVFDVEGDGLKPTKLHCLVAQDVVTNEFIVLKTYDEMREWLSTVRCLIGHNIVMFDIPVLEKMLGIEIDKSVLLIDTLAFSWYLYPERTRHGLESWGEDLNIAKPEITDWENLSQEEYEHRCTEDVKINMKLWIKMKKYLAKIYGSEQEAFPFIKYLEFKMDCIREQARSKWLFDSVLATDAVEKLEAERQVRLTELKRDMPHVEIKSKRTKPAVMHKKDGSLSSHGEKWLALLRLQNLPEDYDGVVEVVTGYEEPNPGSTHQLKGWLTSLGWVPTIFKYKRDKEGNLKEIPQIRDDKSGELCPHIKDLIEDHPALKALDGLSMLNHRIPLLNGLLSSIDDTGHVVARIQGLTNTLRFIHKEVVNLPKPERPYASAIRGSLIAPPGKELCGADMSSLEDRLKHHFLYPHDPDYVKSMSRDDYDPHIALAVLGEGLTKDEGEFFVKWAAVLEKGTEEEKLSVTDEIKKELKRIKPIRGIFKNGNYACQYGAGAARIALTAGISIEQAKVVYEAYWKMNWAIRAVAKEQTVKTVDGQKWLFNPISKFWYSLREEKDRFSTLIQGSASFVFDLWVQNLRSRRPQLTGQFHDEIIICVEKGYREDVTKLLRWAIDLTNSQLNLNRSLDIGIQFGERYSEIH